MARIIPKKKFRRKSNSSVDKNCKDDETDRGSHATTNTNTSGYIPPNKSYHGPLHTNRQAKDVLDSHMPTNDKASQIIDTSYTHHSSPQQLPPTTAIDSDDDKTIDIRESSSSNDVVLMGEKSDVVNTQSPTRTPLPTQQQNNRPRLPSSNNSNIAKETDKDDVDDGEYSKWWFLASISESFDTAALPSPQRNNNDQINTTPTKKRSSSRGKYQKQGSGESFSVSPHKDGIEVKVSKSGDSDSPMHGSNDNDTAGRMYELPSWNKSSADGMASQSPTRSHTYKSSTQMKSSTPKSGREYIEKEQRIRNKWIAKMNGALGGTVKFDNNNNNDDEESLSTMGQYQYIPPKMPMILPTHSRTSDWDMKSMLSNISRKTRSTSEGQIQWTPQDSSYGAAVPAFGFIPKRIRKLLEGIIFVILVCLLLFVVVKLGIMLKNSSSSSGGGQDIEFDDDDHYIANDGEESGDSNDESNDQDQDRFRI